MEPSLSAASLFPDDGLPPGWTVEHLADGSLRVMQTDEARQTTWGPYMPFAIAWNLLVLLMIAISYGLVPGDWTIESYSIIPGVSPLFIFALLGLMFAYSAFWGRRGSDEWIVSLNRLEYRWGHKSSSRRKSRVYVDGAFELRQLEDEGRVYWQLDFKCRNGWMNQGCLWKSHWSPHCTMEQLRNMAHVLSAKTGWPLSTINSS